MKIGLYLFLYGSTSDASEQQASPELQQAYSDLVVRVGKISSFIYDDLKSKPQTRSGVSKPEEIKDHLDKKVINVKERIKHALALCGPGVEQQKKNGQDDYDLINISRAGAGLGIPAHLERPQAAHIAGERGPPGGQTLAEDLNFNTGGGFAGEHGFGLMSPLDFGDDANNVPSLLSDRHGAFGFSPFNQIGGGGGFDPSFDPLGSASFGSSWRRRRSAQSDLRKKIKKMNRTFVPLQSFIRENLSNCREPRILRLEAKVNKMKSRVEKVVKRQGMHTQNSQ